MLNGSALIDRVSLNWTKVGLKVLDLYYQVDRDRVGLNWTKVGLKDVVRLVTVLKCRDV